MRLGCHSLVFGALPAADALLEIARAGFECAVVAEIEGQVRHASQLVGVPLMPPIAIDVAAHEAERVSAATAHAARLGISTVIVTSGGRPGVPQVVVTPRSGSAVWSVQTALDLVARRPDVSFWPDTSHLARAGEDLPRAVRALAPYSAGWFIRDYGGSGTGPGAFETQVPGRGVLDLPRALAALLQVGFDGPLVFHAVGHLPGGRPNPEYPLERLRDLAREARDYLERYATSSAERPT